MGRTGRDQDLRIPRAFVLLLQELLEVGGHEIRLLGRAIVPLQVFHCKENPPHCPTHSGGGQTHRLGWGGGSRIPIKEPLKAQRCWFGA